MVWYDPRHILPFSICKKIPIVVDGKINPSLLAIARRSHWIQNRILRIPDRFGLFSSGPPLLQAYQSQKLTIVTSEAVIPTVTVLILELGDLGLDTRGWLPAFMAVVSLLFTISVYVEEVFFNPMRAPNYHWEALSKKISVVDMAS